MKISVIVPVFNEEKTIIELLTKVNKQNTENFSLEVIVVNDCSTDNSGELIQENEELYSQYIELSQNMGKGGAVREALISASGEYVLFQDADLEYNPEVTDLSLDRKRYPHNGFSGQELVFYS